MHALIDAFYGFVGVYTAAGAYVDANRAALEYTGRIRGADAGAKIWELPYWSSSEAQRERIRDAFARAARGETVRFDAALLDRHGTPRDVDLSLAPIRDADGCISHVITFGVDITERHRAVAALQRSEAQLRAAQRIARVGHYTLEVRSGALEWSEELFRITGRDPLTFSPSIEGFLELVHPDDRERLRRAIAPELLALRAPPDGRHATLEPIEYRLLRPDGATCFLHCEAEATFDLKGRPVFLQGIVHDVTALRRAEDALQRSEQRYRQLVEQAVDGIFLADESGRYVEVNRSGCEMLGYSRDELTHMQIRDVVLQDDATSVAARLGQLAAGESTASARRLRRRDGGLVPVEISAKRLADGHLLAIVRDVTERTRAEVALRDDEARFRSVVESFPSGVLLVGDDGNIAMVNRHLLAQFGYSAEDLIGQSVERLVPTSVRAGHAGHRRQYLREPSPRPMGQGRDLHGLRSDGSLFPVELGLQPLDTPHGEMTLVTVVDITERKRVELALRASEEATRLMIESVQDYAILRLDADGCVASWSAGAERIKGYAAEEILGRHISVFYTPEDIAAGRPACVLKTAAAEGRFEEEAWRVRKDGSRFRASVDVTAIRGERGALLGFSKITRDITERTRAEEELRLHSQVLMSMAEGAHFIDKSGIIRFTNPALDAMFGYERGELVGRHATILNDAGDADNAHITATLRASLEERGVWEGEFRNRRKDGSIFYSRARIAALERPDGPLFISIQEDVTERREAERRIRASLREKETLLREVHHRVKNNLQVICSLLSLQRTAVDGAAAQAVLLDCEDRVRIIAMIHEQLYQSGDLSAIDLGSHVRAIAAKMTRAHAASATVSVDCAGDVVVGLELAVPIGFVLHELVSNSLKHAFPAGGGAIFIDLRRAAGALTVTVRDDGVGAPADWQTHASGTLGLNLVTELARQLDARFDLRNEHGTVATLVVPVSAVPSEPPGGAPLSDTRGQRRGPP